MQQRGPQGVAARAQRVALHSEARRRDARPTAPASLLRGRRYIVAPRVLGSLCTQLALSCCKPARSTK
eukprot:7718202-Alexandrium_andersonii.AAC.1